MQLGPDELAMLRANGFLRQRALPCHVQEAMQRLVEALAHGCLDLELAALRGALAVPSPRNGEAARRAHVRRQYAVCLKSGSWPLGRGREFGLLAEATLQLLRFRGRLIDHCPPIDHIDQPAWQPDAPSGAMQRPRYTSFEQLKSAKTVSDIVRPTRH